MASGASSSIAESESQNGDMGKFEIFESSLSEIRELLENGSITSEKLCEAYIERINAYDKTGIKLNSIISINKNAMAQAKQLDEERQAGTIRGLLHGIPILIKDNIDVSGFPTTLGKTANKDKTAETDAAAVAYLVGQGAIILGKTNLSTDDTATRYTVSALIGETRNAYSTKFSAGGSSGGSAAAVSANLAAAALATDTNFSLAYPAALNGAVSLRPTVGLIDFDGCDGSVPARDTVGPITRSVEDAALLLDIMTDKAQTTPYLKSLSKTALKGKTVLILKELSQYTYNSPNEWKNTDAQITALFSKAVEDIKAQGATAIEVSIPKLFTYFNTCREGSSQSASAKAALLSEVKALMSQHKADAIIYPTYLSSPLPSGFDEYGSHKSAGLNYLNCSGYLPSLISLCSTSVPMGYTKDGIGTGLQFVCLSGEEQMLLSLSYSYEQATAHRKAPEAAPNLYKTSLLPQGGILPDNELNNSPLQNPQPEQGAKGALNWQYIAVAVIVISVLGFCVWVMVFSIHKDSKKSTHKNRHF